LIDKPCRALKESILAFPVILSLWDRFAADISTRKDNIPVQFSALVVQDFNYFESFLHNFYNWPVFIDNSRNFHYFLENAQKFAGFT